MTKSEKAAVIAIVGPTCTGKTPLAIDLAKNLNGEIIALDSRTIYKKMDIGTAKPTPEQQKTIKHYALDLIEPLRFFTVAEYVEIAQSAINDILAKNKIPILCGGTGLYAQALLEGIQIPAVEPDIELRAELNDLAEKKGNAELHKKLSQVDPLSASRLNVNDRRRIIRALEVSIISKKPFSELASKNEPRYKVDWIGLNWQSRDLHKEIIAQRLEEHLKTGLIDEVKMLWQCPDYQSVLSNSINYKEFIPYINGEMSLNDVRFECIKSNFQLARKQMIWFRARSFINWVILNENYSAQNLLGEAEKYISLTAKLE